MEDAVKDDRDLLNRYLDGRLAPDDVERLNERLAAEETLHSQLARARRLRETVSAARADSFAPFFSDRLMRRLLATRGGTAADAFYSALQTAFTRTAVASLVVAGMLAAYNFAAYGDMDVAASVTEALFGLPSASLMDALSYDAF